MSLATGRIVDAIVTGAAAAVEPEDGCRRALDALREGLQASQAILLRAEERWSPPEVVQRSVAPGEVPLAIDPEAPGAALDAAGPIVIDARSDCPALLALAIHPRSDAAWSVALARPGDRPWTDEERATLAALAPSLTLVLEHALLRRRVASAASPETAARGRFLSLLSHELRNPLAPILMWTSTLRRLAHDDPEVERGMRAIEHAVIVARRLLEELSEVSRLERGLLELRRGVLDLRGPVRAAMAGHRSAAEEKHLEVIEDLPATPVPVAGDPDRLRQAIERVVGNAVKFTPAPGTVAASLACDGGHATLRVSDSGPGLPASLLPQLYTPFVQGPNACGGLGVGLAVARWLVQLHGGTIEAVPRGERGGATLVVTLPLHRA